MEGKLSKPPWYVLDRQTQTIFETEIDIKKGNFSMEELEEVLKKIPNNKASGLDNIPQGGHYFFPSKFPDFP